MPRLGAILVVDEHDEALQNEGSPTWNAREVAFERGRRREVPVVLTSPTPSLEAQKWARLEVLGRSEERAGWAALKILDRREEDTGRAGLFSEALIRSLKSPGRVVCVLNRTGRSLLFACRSCNSLASCERCGALVREGEDPATLVCGHCGAVRPHVCANCGMARFKTLRVGVSRAAELLSTLMREPVDELTARAKPGSTLGNARVFLGTEAVLHRVPSASVVAFLEFDQELLAPRYRAAEAALTLLARASRVVGGRAGQVVVQTSMPDHEVLRAAMLAEPALVSESEHVRREMLGFPPARSMVVVGGEHAGEYVREIEAVLAAEGVADAEVVERSPSQWLIRSSQRAAVLNAIASVKRPPGRMRVQVDPMRLPPA
jgi:primosomal protein N' (replication factor Y)